ncbi:MAG TPA: MraY family glycosyltransferase [Candidatus Eisenbacteria bacterium]|nr:MraY family glycosyltransferase [Candidatus Eisenbacteria bacterium]
MTFFLDGAAASLPALILGFLAAAAIAYVLTPMLRRGFRRRGIVDHPDARRVNTRPVPRGGGLAVVAAFVIVGGALTLLRDVVPGVPATLGLQPGQVVALFLGGILAALIGAIDDRLNLRARWQLAGQIGLAALAVALGVTVGVVSNPFGAGVIAFGAPLAIAFTVIWIVGMINSINFIDGLDGLSSGIGVIAAVTLGLLSFTIQVRQPYVAVLCFVLAGALLGFLRWNFHPASVFQGSAGVMFLGYSLAVLSILGTAKVVVALLVLGVPIIDTFWVIVRRIADGRSPFSPDRGHLHHRLLDLGLGHRATVMLIYGICGVLGVLSLLVSAATGVYAFVGALLVLGLLVFFLAREPHEALESASYEDDLGR